MESARIITLAVLVLLEKLGRWQTIVDLFFFFLLFSMPHALML